MPVQRFYLKLPSLWRQASEGVLIGAVIAGIFAWIKGASFSWPNTMPFMGITATVVVATYLFQPTVVSAAGLQAMGILGFRRFVAWSDIVQVDLDRLFLIQPSFKLTDSVGRSYWISRDTEKIETLYALAKLHGGSSHPFTVALETPLYRL
jgi:hypothetical protein